jgi:hypothetical protein
VQDFGFRGNKAANKLRNYHDHGPGPRRRLAPTVELSPKIEVVSVAGLLGEAIRRIARRESISVLFS